eukprot:scaffold1605_cov340-Prasinococcus_capsulatus_cf.AAC.8
MGQALHRDRVPAGAYGAHEPSPGVGICARRARSAPARESQLCWEPWDHLGLPKMASLASSGRLAAPRSMFGVPSHALGPAAFSLTAATTPTTDALGKRSMAHAAPTAASPRELVASSSAAEPGGWNSAASVKAAPLPAAVKGNAASNISEKVKSAARASGDLGPSVAKRRGRQPGAPAKSGAQRSREYRQRKAAARQLQRQLEQQQQQQQLRPEDSKGHFLHWQHDAATATSWKSSSSSLQALAGVASKRMDALASVVRALTPSERVSRLATSLHWRGCLHRRSRPRRECTSQRGATSSALALSGHACVRGRSAVATSPRKASLAPRKRKRTASAAHPAQELWPPHDAVAPGITGHRETGEPVSDELDSPEDSHDEMKSEPGVSSSIKQADDEEPLAKVEKRREYKRRLAQRRALGLVDAKGRGRRRTGTQLTGAGLPPLLCRQLIRGRRTMASL